MEDPDDDEKGDNGINGTGEQYRVVPNASEGIVVPYFLSLNAGNVTERVASCCHTVCCAE